MSLPYAILGLLSFKPMTGYELKKVFDHSISHFWAAHLSQIYRELSSLEKKEWVASVIEAQHDRPDKKIYSITGQGRASFAEWLAHFPDWLSKETRDEFLVRMFFGAEIGKDEMLKQLKRYLSQKQKEKETVIAQIGTNIGKFSGDLAQEAQLTYWRFIEKRAQMSNAALIQWAEDCIRELEG